MPSIYQERTRATNYFLGPRENLLSFVPWNSATTGFRLLGFRPASYTKPPSNVTASASLFWKRTDQSSVKPLLQRKAHLYLGMWKWLAVLLRSEARWTLSLPRPCITPRASVNSASLVRGFGHHFPYSCKDGMNHFSLYPGEESSYWLRKLLWFSKLT